MTDHLSDHQITECATSKLPIHENSEINHLQTHINKCRPCFQRVIDACRNYYARRKHAEVKSAERN